MCDFNLPFLCSRDYCPYLDRSVPRHYVFQHHVFTALGRIRWKSQEIPFVASTVYDQGLGVLIAPICSFVTLSCLFMRCRTAIESMLKKFVSALGRRKSEWGVVWQERLNRWEGTRLRILGLIWFVVTLALAIFIPNILVVVSPAGALAAMFVLIFPGMLSVSSPTHPRTHMHTHTHTHTCTYTCTHNVALCISHMYSCMLSLSHTRHLFGRCPPFFTAHRSMSIEVCPDGAHGGSTQLWMLHCTSSTAWLFCSISSSSGGIRVW